MPTPAVATLLAMGRKIAQIIAQDFLTWRVAVGQCGNRAGAAVDRAVVRTGSSWAVELPDGPVPVLGPALPGRLTEMAAP